MSATRASENAQTDGIALRPATVLDLDSIWAIETAVFGGEAWSREMMREELAAPHRVYLAAIDGAGAILGYGGLLAVGEEGDIQTIAISPAARGVGLGRRMMHALIDAGENRGATQVFLEVRADNPVARGLYESLGFEQIAVRAGYYQPDNIDAVVMRLDLKRHPERRAQPEVARTREPGDDILRSAAQPQNDGEGALG